jgi:hypothetical protein
MSIQLVDIRTSTRGKNPRILTYQGIGQVTPFDRDKDGNLIPADKLESKSDAVDVSGVVTNFKDAVELCGGDMQLALNDFSVGFNYRQRESLLEADEFDGLLDGIDWTVVAKNAGVEDGKTEKGREINAVETVKGQFKRTVRTMVAQSGMELADVVQFLSGKMPKAA